MEGNYELHSLYPNYKQVTFHKCIVARIKRGLSWPASFFNAITEILPGGNYSTMRLSKMLDLPEATIDLFKTALITSDVTKANYKEEVGFDYEITDGESEPDYDGKEQEDEGSGS